MRIRALFVFALGFAATSLQADELWVAPAKNSADRLIADFAVAQKSARFGFGVPDTFNGFTRATVLVIGAKDAEIHYDLKLSISRHLASDTAFVTEMKGLTAIVSKDQLLELEVSPIFNAAPALQAGMDYVSLSIEIVTGKAGNESGSNDGGNNRALVFGLRFQYVGPAGATGPPGEMGPPAPPERPERRAPLVRLALRDPQDRRALPGRRDRQDRRVDPERTVHLGLKVRRGQRGPAGRRGPKDRPA